MQAETQRPTLSRAGRSRHSDVPSFMFWCVMWNQGLHPSSLLVSTRLQAAAPGQRPVRPRKVPRRKKRAQEREEQWKSAGLERSGYRNTVWANQKHSALSPSPPACKMLLIRGRSRANWSNLSACDVRGLSPCPCRSLLNTSAWLLHHQVQRGRIKINKSAILPAHFSGTLPQSFRPDTRTLLNYVLKGWWESSGCFCSKERTSNRNTFIHYRHGETEHGEQKFLSRRTATK